jgi:hypothetical protein
MAPLHPEGRRRVRLSTGEYTLTVTFWMIAAIMAIEMRDPR